MTAHYAPEPSARADMFSAGITSPELLAHCIEHATQRADPAPRLTPSRRYRRWKAIAVRIAVIAAGFAIYHGVSL